MIGVPGKVVYLHYTTTVYCACLSDLLVAFVPLSRMLPCWERASHSALRVCCRKMFCCVLCTVLSFPAGVYVGTLNLIASIPGPSIFTLPRYTIRATRRYDRKVFILYLTEKLMYNENE